MFLSKAALTASSAYSLVPACAAAPHSCPTGSGFAVSSTTCNGKTYTYEELAGYGYLPSNGRDDHGDTLGGIGSSAVLDITTWRKLDNGSYTGLLYGLPDRGWNTEGTLNFQNRLHRIQITLNPADNATVANPSGPNLNMEYLDSIYLTDPTGTPTSGLDGGLQGPYLSFPHLGVPDVPSTTYEGDGFGGPGNGGTRVVLDPEGLVFAHDGSFWISDEYGPYIYHFTRCGTMIGAIRPPDAIIPTRNGSDAFTADSPPRYDESIEPDPEDQSTGRNNNQGFEGLTANPAGTKLYVLLQSATNQEGGFHNRYSRHSRFLVYDITASPPTYEAEYIVQLNHVVANDSSSDVARQSEIHYISDTQFMVLARDGDAGRGQGDTESLYRQIDIFDISAATNIKGASADCASCSVASAEGVLNQGTSNLTVTPAKYCNWLDFNLNSQLNRFGVHNGGRQDEGLLNEKWESIAVAPVHPNAANGSTEAEEYFLISLSDNDFITQQGYMNSGALEYADESGFDLLNQGLVFKVRLPSGAKPLVS